MEPDQKPLRSKRLGSVVTAEFFGGPRDGDRQQFRNLPKQVATIPGISAWEHIYRLAARRGGIGNTPCYVFVGWYNRKTKERL
jgi:hypothetical protein